MDDPTSLRSGTTPVRRALRTPLLPAVLLLAAVRAEPTWAGERNAPAPLPPGALTALQPIQVTVPTPVPAQTGPDTWPVQGTVSASGDGRAFALVYRSADLETCLANGFVLGQGSAITNVVCTDGRTMVARTCSTVGGIDGPRTCRVPAAP